MIQRRMDEVILVADGKHFRCSKAKLVEKSDYFRALLSGNFADHAKDTFDLMDVDSRSLEILLNYVEGEKYFLPPDHNDLIVLLQSSSLLLFTDVQDKCIKALAEAISVKNCLKVHEVADCFGLSALSDAAWTYALWMFPSVALHTSFLQLKFKDLMAYLSNPSLNTLNDEYSLWSSIAHWVEHDHERSHHLPELIKVINFARLKLHDLANVCSSSLVKKNKVVYDLLYTMYKCRTNYLCSPGVIKGTSISSHESRSTESSAIICPALNGVSRKFAKVPCVIALCSNELSWDDMKRNQHPHKLHSEFKFVLYSFDFERNELCEEAHLDRLFEGFNQCIGYKVVPYGPAFYITGGEFKMGYSCWNTELLDFTNVTKQWICESELPSVRRHHYACFHDNSIYLFGGYGKHRVTLYSVEAYNMDTCDWTRCCEMPRPVHNGAAVSYKSYILLFGCQNQVFMFDSRQNKWIVQEISGPEPPGYHEAHVHGDWVYLTGYGSKMLYGYHPETRRMHAVGSFTCLAVNTCLVDDRIVNFGYTDEDTYCVEVFEVAKVWCQACCLAFQDSAEFCGCLASSALEPLCRMGEGQLCKSKVVKEGPAKPTMYYFGLSNTENSRTLGCFSLMKCKRKQI